MSSQDMKYGNKTFASDVEDWVLRTENALLAVGRASVQDVMNEANQSFFKGGRMPVKTGFLRASLRAKVGSIPSGPTRGEKDGTYTFPDDVRSDGTINLAIAEWKAGETLYFGWTAEYALPQEYRNGFVEGATQNWSRIVAWNADTVKKRLGL